MSLLYLVRHAATQPNPDQHAGEWTLSEAGFLAAGVLAGRRFWPEIDRVITSTEFKSYATVAPALELWGLSHEAWSDFDEVKRGGYIEDYTARVADFFAHPDHSPDAWETATAALQRAITGLHRALHAYHDSNIALVGHGLLWSLLRARLLGLSHVNPAEWAAVAMPDVAVWRVENDTITLLQDFEGIRSHHAQK